MMLGRSGNPRAKLLKVTILSILLLLLLFSLLSRPGSSRRPQEKEEIGAEAVRAVEEPKPKPLSEQEEDPQLANERRIEGAGNDDSAFLTIEVISEDDRHALEGSSIFLGDHETESWVRAGETNSTGRFRLALED